MSYQSHWCKRPGGPPHLYRVGRVLWRDNRTTKSDQTQPTLDGNATVQTIPCASCGMLIFYMRNLSNKKQRTDLCTPGTWTFKDIINFCCRWLFIEHVEANFIVTACRLLTKQEMRGALREVSSLKKKKRKTSVVVGEEGNISTLPPLEKH